MNKIEKLKKYRACADEIKNLEDMECGYEIARKIERLKQQQYIIFNAINQVEDDNERNVLQQRYLLGRKFETIANRMNYCSKHIYRIHDRAIKNINI